MREPLMRHAAPIQEEHWPEPSKSLRQAWCKNVNEFLIRKSFFEEPFKAVEGLKTEREREGRRKKRKTFSRCLSGWATTGLISVNQLHRGSWRTNSQHSSYYCKLLSFIIPPRKCTKTHILNRLMQCFLFAHMRHMWDYLTLITCSSMGGVQPSNKI